MVSECKHGLRTGCAYCHGNAVARFTMRRGRQSDRVVNYAAKVDEAMQRTGPLAMQWRSDYRPIKRGLASFQTGYGGA